MDSCGAKQTRVEVFPAVKRCTPWLLCVLFLSFVGLPASSPAQAQEARRGVIGPAEHGLETSFAWKGPPPAGGVSGPNLDGCTQPGMYCDIFELQVEVPPEYWAAKSGGVEVEIAWPDPTDDYRICVEETCESGWINGQFGSVSVFVERASGPLNVRVIYDQVVDNLDGYTGIARFVSDDAPAGAIFDEQTPIGFGPATIVSPNFLGPEPQMAVERRHEGASGGSDVERIFVDWPMGLASQTSQLHRSEDGGDSFRLLFDMRCAIRNRPTCQTGGGGDSESAVNPFNGHVYFADLETANVAFASSTNNGDDFPDSRQFAISNTATALDRQWITPAEPGRSTAGPSGVPIDAFLSYDEGLFTKAVQGVSPDGVPIPQPHPQLPDPGGQKGPIVTDTTGGPADGWLYALGGFDAGGHRVATVPGSDYQKPLGVAGGWRDHLISRDNTELFRWIALDGRGNAYTTWVTDGEPEAGGKAAPWIVRFSASDIDDAANNPKKGGWPGTKWTEPVRVSLPSLGSAIFGAVTAGDPGRVGITYMGTDDHVGEPGSAPAGAEWKTYAAVITNGLSEGGPPVVRTGEVSARVAHTGHICTGGLIGCNDDTGDRSLLDLIDINFDPDGRLAVVSMDNHSAFAEKMGAVPIAGQKMRPFAHFSKQVTGPSVLAGPDLDVPVPRGVGADRLGDAKWPNKASGANLRTLDVDAASLALEGSRLVARIRLAEATPTGMQRDIGVYQASYPPTAPKARRLQYTLRFSTDHEIYHISMEHRDDGVRRAFGGKLDDNDRLGTSPGNNHTNGAGYHTDDVRVDAEVEDGTLILSAPAESFGLTAETRLFSVTAFSMAGPLEEQERTIQDIMRTIDASPPLDMILGHTPTPEPTPTPTSDPTPTPDRDSRCDILGTSGNDHLRGTRRGDTICGLGGDDILVGRGGDDILLGGAGADRLRGGRGVDSLRGGPGRDRCRGGSGRNHRRGCESR